MKTDFIKSLLCGLFFSMAFESMFLVRRLWEHGAARLRRGEK